ncbi:MAG: Ig-like domain-containing protein, partial [Bacteroidota bacterium]
MKHFLFSFLFLINLPFYLQAQNVELSRLSPANNSTNVGLSSNYFEVQFDQNIIKGTGGINIYKSTNDSLFARLDINQSGVFVYDATLGFYPNNDLFEASTSYYILLDSGLVSGTIGDSFSGITDKSVWTFTTQDSETDPPVIDFLRPSDNQLEVEISRRYFNIYFNEPIIPGSSGNITIYKTEDNSIHQQFSIEEVNFWNTEISFTVSTNFETETEYYILVDAGFAKDVFDNDFAGISNAQQWNFTTQAPETDPPLISYQFPSDDQSGVSINGSSFGIVFDESIERGSGNITILDGTDDSVFETIDINGQAVSVYTDQIAFYPRNTFEPSTNYYIQVDAGIVRDIFG